MAIRSSTAVCIAAISTTGALATWDFTSSAGLTEAWSENTTFTAASGNGDAITSLRLTGEIDQMGPQSSFHLAYTPNAQFYRDQPSLNYVGHLARASWLYRFSDRNSVSLTDQFLYTPDQKLDSQSYQSHLLYTSYGGRRTNLGGVTWRHTLSLSGSMYAAFRTQYRSFVDPSLIDSAGISTGPRWEKAVSQRTMVESGLLSAWNRFTRPRSVPFEQADPNHPNANLACIEFSQDYPPSQVRT